MDRAPRLFIERNIIPHQSRKTYSTFNLNGLANLECLKLRDFDWKQNDPFVNISKLRQLKIERCRNVEMEFFQKFPNLEKFNCHATESLPLQSLSNLTNLKCLQLSGVVCESLDFLKKLRNLVSLDLTYFEYKSIANDAFKELQSLEHFEVEISKHWAQFLPNFRHLSFFGQLSELKLKFGDSMNANYLFTYKTQTLFGSFYNFASLKKLTIRGDDFVECVQIDEQVFGYFPNLLFLELVRIDKFEITAQTFSKNRYLKKLIIEFCNFKDLPGFIFTNLRNLTMLSLRHNHLETLDENTFDGLCNLRDLNLIWNVLIEFDINCLSKMPNLKRLLLGLMKSESKITIDIVESRFPNILNIECDYDYEYYSTGAVMHMNSYDFFEC